MDVKEGRRLSILAEWVIRMNDRRSKPYKELAAWLIKNRESLLSAAEQLSALNRCQGCGGVLSTCGCYTASSEFISTLAEVNARHIRSKGKGK